LGFGKLGIGNLGCYLCYHSASSTTETGRHDMAEILLKVALNTKILIQIRFSNFKLLLLPTFWT
jgi:hypothetical protein